MGGRGRGLMPKSPAATYGQLGGASRAVLAVIVAVGLIALAVVLNLRAPPTAIDLALPLVASGRAESIDDGDTFVFVPTSAVGSAVRRVRIRLHAVDAPELAQSSGWAARAALAELLHSARITVDCYKQDARGRAVCRVRAQAHDTGVDTVARDVELVLLEAGLAWHYEAFAREQTPAERDSYARAMAQARAARRGLWQHEAPMAPWQCRERLRAGSLCD